MRARKDREERADALERHKERQKAQAKLRAKLAKNRTAHGNETTTAPAGRGRGRGARREEDVEGDEEFDLPQKRKLKDGRVIILKPGEEFVDVSSVYKKATTVDCALRGKLSLRASQYWFVRVGLHRLNEAAKTNQKEDRFRIVLNAAPGFGKSLPAGILTHCALSLGPSYPELKHLKVLLLTPRSLRSNIANDTSKGYAEHILFQTNFRERLFLMTFAEFEKEIDLLSKQSQIYQKYELTCNKVFDPSDTKRKCDPGDGQKLIRFDPDQLLVIIDEIHLLNTHFVQSFESKKGPHRKIVAFLRLPLGVVGLTGTVTLENLRFFASFLRPEIPLQDIPRVAELTPSFFQDRFLTDQFIEGVTPFGYPRRIDRDLVAHLYEGTDENDNQDFEDLFYETFRTSKRSKAADKQAMISNYFKSVYFIERKPYLFRQHIETERKLRVSEARKFNKLVSAKASYQLFSPELLATLCISPMAYLVCETIINHYFETIDEENPCFERPFRVVLYVETKREAEVMYHLLLQELIKNDVPASQSRCFYPANEVLDLVDFVTLYNASSDKKAHINILILDKSQTTGFNLQATLALILMSIPQEVDKAVQSVYRGLRYESHRHLTPESIYAPLVALEKEEKAFPREKRFQTREWFDLQAQKLKVNLRIQKAREQYEFVFVYRCRLQGQAYKDYASVGDYFAIQLQKQLDRINIVNAMLSTISIQGDHFPIDPRIRPFLEAREISEETTFGDVVSLISKEDVEMDEFDLKQVAPYPEVRLSKPEGVRSKPVSKVSKTRGSPASASPRRGEALPLPKPIRLKDVMEAGSKASSKASLKGGSKSDSKDGLKTRRKEAKEEADSNADLNAGLENPVKRKPDARIRALQKKALLENQVRGSPRLPS